MGKYLIRRSFFVPKEELSRYYGRQGKLSPSDLILEVDNDKSDDYED